MRSYVHHTDDVREWAYIGPSIPFLLTMLVGRHLIKMHPGVLLGVCAGAGTSAPGLAAV